MKKAATKQKIGQQHWPNCRTINHLQQQRYYMCTRTFRFSYYFGFGKFCDCNRIYAIASYMDTLIIQPKFEGDRERERDGQRDFTNTHWNTNTQLNICNNVYLDRMKMKIAIDVYLQ